MSRNYTTDVGRLVQGDCFEAQTKDQQGALRVVKTGPNAGQPNPQFFIAVAFAKNSPAWPAFWAEMVTEAAASFPHLFPQGPQPHLPNGGCVLPAFAFKVVDGDGVDSMGKPNSAKEGFAGHWIVRFATTYAPKVYRPANGAHVEVTSPAEIKRGYYVRVAGSMKGNDNPQRPGLFVNFNMVEVVGYGQEIISGPSASEAFGQPVGALPPGASPMPLAPAAVPPGAQAPAPAPAPGYAPPPGSYAPPPGAPAAYAPPPAGAAPAYAPPPTAAQPAPYAGFVPGAGAPPQAAPAAYAAPPMAPAAPAAPPPVPQRVMLPAANGHSYESLVAAGWTDAALVQHGMMAA